MDPADMISNTRPSLGPESDSATSEPTAQTPENQLSPIIEFYQGGNDAQGRTLANILQWPDSKLEYTHDYIQILFPIPEWSNFMLYPAPRLDGSAMNAFRNDSHLQVSMRRAFARMLDFFGFIYDITSLKDSTDSHDREMLCNIAPDNDRFPKAARNWFNSHNDLRITRIIRCLRCCGMETEAQSFYSALQIIYVNRIAYPRRINDRTFMYWTRAAKRDIRIPPDSSDSEAAEILEKLQVMINN